jgi:hypothetical protein
MDTSSADLARLSLLIQRILDAEALLDAQGAALLTETEAASHSLEAGDAKAARLHVEEVARFTEALVRSEALAPLDGRAVLTTANAILLRQEQETGGSAR